MTIFQIQTTRSEWQTRPEIYLMETSDEQFQCSWSSQAHLLADFLNLRDTAPYLSCHQLFLPPFAGKSGEQCQGSIVHPKNIDHLVRPGPGRLNWTSASSGQLLRSVIRICSTSKALDLYFLMVQGCSWMFGGLVSGNQDLLENRTFTRMMLSQGSCSYDGNQQKLELGAKNPKVLRTAGRIDRWQIQVGQRRIPTDIEQKMNTSCGSNTPSFSIRRRSCGA